jgi:CRISPR system Cascade subunit CasC
MSRLFVDFHVIQSVPPSCVNRDDTGSPKIATYGGVRRARVSSQAWKRAVRLSFKDCFDEQSLGVRTQDIVAMIAEHIRNSGKAEEEALEIADKILNAAGVTTKKKEKKKKNGEDDAAKEAKALFFMSHWQARKLAQLAIDGMFDKQDAQAALNKDHGIDIALFGRMVADAPSLNVDASAQVAHAISTHRVDNEYDYFTAVDDRAPEDNAGAGMISTVEFNSATLYRYATIAAHELHKNLGDATTAAKAVAEFARAFITAMPTGKQNTFANRTLPYAVLVTVRTDQPINFAGAFEAPVKPGEGGYNSRSVTALRKYAAAVYADFASAPEKSFIIGAGLDEAGEKMTEKVTVEGLYTALLNEIDARLSS